MGRQGRYSPEVRERAVRLVVETEAEHPSQWAAICSIASRIGCTPETLRKWVRQAEIDSGHGYCRWTVTATGLADGDEWRSRSCS